MANLAAQFQQEGPCECDSFLQFDDDGVYALFYPKAVFSLRLSKNSSWSLLYCVYVGGLGCASKSDRLVILVSVYLNRQTPSCPFSTWVDSDMAIRSAYRVL